MADKIYIAEKILTDLYRILSNIELASVKNVVVVISTIYNDGKIKNTELAHPYGGHPVLVEFNFSELIPKNTWEVKFKLQRD
jgi:hypothetical protein